MRLNDLRKTSAFRLTLLFSALLIGSVRLLLFGFVYWQTAAFLSDRFDQTLAGEAEEIVRTPDTARTMALDNLISTDPHRDWLGALFDRQRNFLSGNIEVWPQGIIADGKSHDLPPHIMGPARHGGGRDLRGLALQLPDGHLLVLAHRVDEVHEVRELIVRALTAGLIGSVGLALAGGAVMSYASLRRIEGMHRAAAAIMGGDLARRLPVAGSGDDFDKLADIVNAMLAEIERLIGDIKAAGDNIAHDLRTPLTPLRTRLEGALRRGGDVTGHRAAMEDAIADTDQILATFKALLRIGEVEGGRAFTTDNGPGLPEGFKDALFQRFTRSDKARHLPGNGLGLSLVAAVARLHGFALAFDDSAPGCRAVITTGTDKVG